MTPLHCGIDFGTTNSSLSISSNGKTKIIPIDRLNPNNTILRSLIYINPKQEITFGHQAINRYLTDLSTLPSVPLRLEYTGKKVKVMVPTGSGVMKADLVPEIIEVDDSGRGRLLQSLKSVLTSKLFTGTNIFGQFYSLEELLTKLLKHIKTQAEIEIQQEITSAVIGRPVRYVGSHQDQIALDRMKNIASNAGFKQVEFEYEPVGAALNYSISHQANQNILVYDFGGGTLDLCIMHLPDNQILSVSGRGLGGDLLNSQIVKSSLLPHFGSEAIINQRLPFPKHFFSAFDSWYQTTLQKNLKNIENLKKLAIESDTPDKINNLINLINHDYGFDFFNTVDSAKISLSTLDSTSFEFNRPNLTIQQHLTRQEFETSISEQLVESTNCINEVLKLANLKSTDIDQVILTGGSSQVPAFVNQISTIFSPAKVTTSNYFTSVASGLSLRAEQLFSC